MIATLVLALLAAPEDQCGLVPNSLGMSLHIQSPHMAPVNQPVGYFAAWFPPGAGNLLLVVSSYTRWRYKPMFSVSELCIGPVFQRHNLWQPLGANFVGSWDPTGYMPGDHVYVQWVHTDWVVPVNVWNMSRVVEIDFYP